MEKENISNTLLLLLFLDSLTVSLQNLHHFCLIGSFFQCLDEVYENVEQSSKSLQWLKTIHHFRDKKSSVEVLLLCENLIVL